MKHKKCSSRRVFDKIQWPHTPLKCVGSLKHSNWEGDWYKSGYILEWDVGSAVNPKRIKRMSVKCEKCKYLLEEIELRNRKYIYRAYEMRTAYEKT